MMRVIGLVVGLLLWPSVSTGAPQILADVDFGVCKCPVREDLECDEFRVDWPVDEVPIRVNLFVHGVDRVAEVRFGLIVEGEVEGGGLRGCQGFNVIQTDSLDAPGIEVRCVPYEECYKTGTGLSFLYCHAFHVRGPGRVRLLPDPALGHAQVTDCDGNVHVVPDENLAIIGAIGVPGYNPCHDAVPVMEESWSKIKKHYRP